MAQIEWWPNTDIGTDKAKNKPTGKEKISGAKNSLNKIEKVAVKPEILRMQEIQKAFPRLSKTWLDKIAVSFNQFDVKSTADFFQAIKKYNAKDYPQSLIWVSLIQYAKNSNGQLSVENYETYLQTLVDEHTKLKQLYLTFSTKNDPAFADFKRFKLTYKNTWQSIDQIAEGKWFTNDTYVFYQYLASTSFQKNKVSILGSLSSDDRRQFDWCMRRNRRMSQIIWVPPNPLYATWDNAAWENQQVLEAKEGSFADIKSTFTKDFDKQDWPKQIVENVDKTVFGEEWLMWKDMKDILSTFQKKLSRSQWEAFIKQYEAYMPKWMPPQMMLQFCMWEPITRRTWEKINPAFGKNIEARCNTVFENIVKKELQPETKQNIQQYVMEVYFEQVAWILEAGWEIVTTDSTEYHNDGTIDMKYSTLHGIHGTMHISSTGEVSILDMFAYRSGNEKWDNQNIIEKIQDKLMDGKLPSMKDMMARCSGDKPLLFDNWASRFGWWENKEWSLIPKLAVVPDMISEGEEHSRKVLDGSMNKILSMTQTADRIWSFVENTYTTLGLPQNDMYTRYLKWEVPFLDSKANTQVEWLFALRSDFISNDEHIDRFNNALEKLLWVVNSSTITKEHFPFGAVEGDWKETVFQFIARFCPTDKEFDIQKFEDCVQKIDTQKPNIPESIAEFYFDNVSLFPLKSLYLSRHPEANIYAEKEKAKEEVYNETRKKLSDLKDDIQLSIDLDKANVK